MIDQAKLDAACDAFERLEHQFADAATPLTQKWRVIMRGIERHFTDPQHPANVRRHEEYNTEEAWARRRAATNPKNAGKLRFSPEGKLLNKVDLNGNLLD